MTVPTSSARRVVVGRDVELALLEDAWERCLGDEPQLVIVRGEAGLGKTTLIREIALRHAEDATVVVGHCLAGIAESLPYAPITQALKGILARYGAETVTGWAGAGHGALSAVLPGVGAPSTGEPDRMQLFEAVTSVLERAAHEHPLILVIEDLHWADRSSSHLLRFLEAALTRAPIMTVVTFRTDEIAGRHPLRPLIAELQRRPAATSVALPPLAPGEVAQLVRSIRADATAPVIAHIVDRSEGVPYFVEELARGGGARGLFPLTLHEALLGRIQRLSEPTVRLLGLAAVAGVRFGHDMLAAVCLLDDEALDAALREAVDAGILTPHEDGYSFRHALLQEVVYHELLPGEHARLHARYADLLTAQPELDPGARPQFVHHLLHANRVDAAFRACIAGARALNDAHLDCLRLYEQALELWDRAERPEEVVGGGRDLLLEWAAQAAYWNGEADRALALIRESLDRTPPDAEPLQRARRLTLKARATNHSARSGSETIAEEALALTPDGRPTSERAEVIDFLAMRDMLHGRWSRSVARCDEGIEIARAVGRPAIIANLLITKGNSLCHLGREEAGLALIEEGGRLSWPRRRLRYHTNLSHHQNLVGDYRGAAESARTGVEAARALGLERFVGSMLAGNTAEPLIALGEWEEAERTIQRALALNPGSGDYLQLRMLIGELAFERGDSAIVEDILAELETIFGAGEGEPQYVTSYTWLFARHALARGATEAAWAAVSPELPARTPRCRLEDVAAAHRWGPGAGAARRRHRVPARLARRPGRHGSPRHPQSPRARGVPGRAGGHGVRVGGGDQRDARRAAGLAPFRGGRGARGGRPAGAGPGPGRQRGVRPGWRSHDGWGHPDGSGASRSSWTPRVRVSRRQPPADRAGSPLAKPRSSACSPRAGPTAGSAGRWV